MRKSLRRKSLRRKSIDGKGKKNELTPSSIKLEKYILNMLYYYNEAFINTLSTFKVFKPKSLEEIPIYNNTYDFIVQLFNFDRNINLNYIYMNQRSVLSVIIILGLYEEFENLLNKIKIIDTKGGVSESKNDETMIDCIEKNKIILNNKKISEEYIKTQHKNLSEEEYKKFTENEIRTQHYKKLTEEEIEIMTKINIIPLNIVVEFIKNMKKKTTYKNVCNDFSSFINDNIENEIYKFIFYSVCIGPETRKLIMRHYLLSFIKLKPNILRKYNIIIDSSADDNNSQKIINEFLVNIDKFKVLEYISIKYTKKDKEYNFSTCGETTILNLLNYYFINKDGTFNIKNTYSKPLKNFYYKYKTMENMKNEEIDIITKDWLDVVSNLRNTSIYNYNGDIHNNIKNIKIVLETILTDKDYSYEKYNSDSEYNDDEYNSDEEYNDIIKILNKINPKIEIDIIQENENQIELLLDNRITVFFRPGHGELNYYLFKTVKNQLIELDDIDCKELYYNIFTKINYNNDYYRELKHVLEKYVYEYIVNKKNNKTVEHFLKSNPVYIDINLSDKNLTELPEIFFIKIANLNISNNKLTELPETFGNFNFDKLNISNNKLTELPESFGTLKFNVEINISNNQLKELPSTFCNIEWLNQHNYNYTHSLNFPPILDISHNKLTKLPELFGNLKYIVSLDISNNLLIELYESFVGESSSLKFLNISSNNLTKLPESFSKLNKLIRIDLSNNKFNEIPESIQKLSFITFNISGNYLSNITEKSIDFLKKINFLNLSNNKLLELSESFCNLKNLVNLDISDNKLLKLSESFGGLSNLDNLNISNIGLTELPISFGKLKKIRILNISGNNLTELNELFGEFTNLQLLNISGNKLTKLPKSIWKLQKIEELYIHNNELTELDETFNKLRLKTLNLSYNYFTQIPITSINTGIEKLDLSHNNLKSLRDDIEDIIHINKLYRLKEMDLSNNQLSELPESFHNFNLKTLNLSNNKFTKIPITSINGHLRELNLTNNYVSDDNLNEIKRTFGDLKLIF